MANMTPIDVAHAAMLAAPEDESARRRFYEVLAASELCLLLGREAEGDVLDPAIFEPEGAPCVLVFDREERLAEFAEGASPYAALSGRALALMLAGRGIGLGLNLGVAPSAILLPAEAMDWLAGMLPETPEEIAVRPVEFLVPKGLPEAVLRALDARLASLEGLAEGAWLVVARYEGGGQGHLLGFVGTTPGAESALARAVSEVLAFSGLEAAALDVGFFGAGDPVVARMAGCGLRFDLPKAAAPAPKAPGSDPQRPPRLR
ncbi:SseB family protein [Roseovarius autotrophicus]|uniref:SseB family protein n=1 Tax=Roseovarius autotrophicus TaxID=2824121 RepID=UPI001A091B66|nr:SseB family protein [Roseovarius autotrophicus]MBE0454364.1 SseB family protein [Roseovarius sp.]